MPVLPSQTAIACTSTPTDSCLGISNDLFCNTNNLCEVANPSIVPIVSCSDVSICEQVFGSSVSTTCNQTCEVAVSFEQSREINISTDVPEYQDIEIQNWDSVTFQSIRMDVSQNSFTIDAPEVDLYLAPMTVTELFTPGSDPPTLDPDVQRLGSVQGIAQGALPVDVNVALDPNGESALNTYCMDPQTTFQLFGYATLTLRGGDPIPTGALGLQLDVEATEISTCGVLRMQCSYPPCVTDADCRTNDQVRCIDGTCQYDIQLHHIIRNSGGVRVNDDGLFMKIPSVTYKGNSTDNSSCSHYSSEECTDEKLLLPEDAPVIYKAALQLNHIGTLADFPKLIHTGINHAQTTLQDTINTGTPQEADAAQRSLDALNALAPEVVCNVPQNPSFISTRDCSGSVDTDGDGFCDAIDYCHNTYSGSNCDTDGDFVGDGARSGSGDCGLVDILLSNVIDDPYYLAQLRKMMCGACDKCQGVDDVAHPYDRDGDGLLDYRDSTHECDPDIDGDGVVNDDDCYPKNHLVRFDLDEDGKCDDGFVNRPDLWEDNPLLICRNQCFTNRNQHGDSAQDRIECAMKCRKDNCAPPVDVWTHLCPFGEETRRLDCRTAILPGGQCPQGYNTLLGTCSGVNDADPFCGHLKACKQAGAQCDDYDSDKCFKVYANLSQKDNDDDGIGDKCDWCNVGKPGFTKSNSSFVLESGGQAHLVAMGEEYKVSFRAWGGSVSLDETQSPPALAFEPEIRNNSQIGACWCDLKNPDGSWHDLCYLHSRCSVFQDKKPPPNNAVPVWAPIQAPECSSLPFTGNPADESLYNAIGYCYNREIPFSRDEASNYYQFHWRWGMTPDFQSMTQSIGWTFDKDQGSTPPRTTKVRVAWPRRGHLIDLGSDQFKEAAWSSKRAMQVTSMDDFAFDPQTQFPLGRILDHFTEMSDGWSGPIPHSARSGYLLVKDIKGSSVGLLALRPGIPEVDLALVTSFSEPLSTSAELTGVSGPVSTSVIGGTAEVGNGVFLYQGPSSSAKLFVGLEQPDSNVVQFHSAQMLWGAVAPSAYDVRLLYLPDRMELLLLGGENPGDPRDRVWLLRLGSSEWEGPFRPDGLRGMSNYTADYDPVRRNVVIFGGVSSRVSESPEEGPGGNQILSDEIRLLDPASMRVTVAAPASPTPPGLARMNHGSRLDAQGRSLYVFGGTDSKHAFEDGWRYDLRQRRWHSLGAIGPSLTEPLVHYDRDNQTLWVADLAVEAVADGFDLWSLDRGGRWVRRPALAVASAQVWPAEDAVLHGQTRSFLWSTDDAAALPGKYWLARLDADTPALEVQARVLGELTYNLSKLDPSGLQAAGFFCPTGEQCMLEVGLREGAGRHSSIQFTLDIVEAAPVLTSEAQPHGTINGMALGKDGRKLYVVGPWGLKMLDSDDLVELAWMHGNDIGGTQGVTYCGSKLCLARSGSYGLAVIEPAMPSVNAVLAAVLTGPGGKDLAARGGRVYLARSNHGVSIYDVSQPTTPSLVGQISLTSAQHRAVTVAVSGKLLAVGLKHGTVELYDISQAPLLVGTLQASGQIARVRFRGGQLWVLDKNHSMVEVFEVIDLAAPVRIGAFYGPDIGEIWAVYRGTRRFVFHGNLVSAYRLEQVDP